jgi:hypothetical protein
MNSLSVERKKKLKIMETIMMVKTVFYGSSKKVCDLVYGRLVQGGPEFGNVRGKISEKTLEPQGHNLLV